MRPSKHAGAGGGLKVLVCMLTVTAAAGAGGNSPSTIVNGGFEEWEPAPADLQQSMDCPQMPTGWGVAAGVLERNYSLREDTAIKHGGAASLRLSNTDTKGGITIAQRFDAAPEYRYRIDMWMKGDHIDNYHPKGVIVHVLASTQTDKKDNGMWTGKLSYEFKSTAPNSGTFDWQELVFAFDTPVNTKTIILLVELRGAGAMWLDDVEVTPLEKSIEVESY